MSEWEQVLLSCQTLLKSNTSRLPDTNIYQLKLLDLAMDACINLGLWEEALHYGNRTLEPYRWELALLWFIVRAGFHPGGETQCIFSVLGWYKKVIVFPTEAARNYFVDIIRQFVQMPFSFWKQRINYFTGVGQKNLFYIYWQLCYTE